MSSTMATMRIATSSLLFLVALFSLASIHFSTAYALPTSEPESPFRFDITAPTTSTEWSVDSLSTIAWDTSKMPAGSTMDIALMQHAKKQSILLRRYVPTKLGALQLNLGPEIAPGSYSLLLTVYKGRTSTVVGRSLVPTLSIVEEEDNQEEDEELVAPAQVLSIHGGDFKMIEEPRRKTSSKNGDDAFHFKKEYQDAVLDEEPVKLNYESGGKSMVLMAPYTIGWSIPKALENTPRARVNILLVSSPNEPSENQAKVVRVLRNDIDARAGFQFVFLPRDLPRANSDEYQIRIEIFGKGRKFVGHTHRFSTQLPAFAAEP